MNIRDFWTYQTHLEYDLDMCITLGWSFIHCILFLRNKSYRHVVAPGFDCDFSDRSFSFHDFELVFEAVVACTLSPNLFLGLDNCPVSEINVLVSYVNVVLLHCKLYFGTALVIDLLLYNFVVNIMIRSTEVLSKMLFHLTSSGKWMLILDVEADDTLSISIGSAMSPLLWNRNMYSRLVTYLLFLLVKFSVDRSSYNRKF